MGLYDWNILKYIRQDSFFDFNEVWYKKFKTLCLDFRRRKLDNLKCRRNSF